MWTLAIIMYDYHIYMIHESVLQLHSHISYLLVLMVYHPLHYHMRKLVSCH